MSPTVARYDIHTKHGRCSAVTAYTQPKIAELPESPHSSRPSGASMPEAALLAVSNIAWAPHEDEAIAAVLRREGVAGVELAPTKWREQPLEARVEEIAEYRRTWEDRGLRIVSLQSLLFGRPELQLFGSAAIRAALADYLRRVIDFGAELGAHALVFGSPKNRLRGSLSIGEANDIAIPFFRQLGEHAACAAPRSASKRTRPTTAVIS